MELSPHTTARQGRNLSTVLFISGLVFIAAGIVIGVFVSGLGFILLAVGAIDLIVARQFVPERSGTILPPDDDTHADADLLASDAEPDATANPYARED